MNMQKKKLKNLGVWKKSEVWKGRSLIVPLMHMTEMFLLSSIVENVTFWACRILFFLKSGLDIRCHFHFHLKFNYFHGLSISCKKKKRLNLHQSLLIRRYNRKFGLNMGCKFGLSEFRYQVVVKIFSHTFVPKFFLSTPGHNCKNCI